MVAGNKEEVSREFMERGCSIGHEYFVDKKVTTTPPLYEYKCEDCGNTVVVVSTVHDRIEGKRGIVTESIDDK